MGNMLSLCGLCKFIKKQGYFNSKEQTTEKELQLICYFNINLYICKRL